MRLPARLALGLLAAGILLQTSIAVAEQWGGIEPGESTMTSVRKLRGAPSRTATQKVDGYDTQAWVYDESRAPGGIRKMTVDFGLMTPKGYQAEVVRSLGLEPKPGAFSKGSILAGWGPPAGVGKEGDNEFFFYKEGLFVYFDKDGERVVSMVFTPPQLPPAEVSPKP